MTLIPISTLTLYKQDACFKSKMSDEEVAEAEKSMRGDQAANQARAMAMRAEQERQVLRCNCQMILQDDG